VLALYLLGEYEGAEQELERLIGGRVLSPGSIFTLHCYGAVFSRDAEDRNKRREVAERMISQGARLARVNISILKMHFRQKPEESIIESWNR